MVWESLKQIIEDLGLTKGVFFRYFAKQCCNLSNLSLLEETFCVLLYLLQVLCLKSDQTLANTDRFIIQTECRLVKSLPNCNLLLIMRFRWMKRKKCFEETYLLVG
jgi:hypothetical protein